ncbi:hypothetical protein B0H14DRAFT_3756698 [Mycena olivaceomarginata]|nr:hypothetical protein B0H14DRAFT_3756698 [Mycena olivaceomarginata]
MESETAHPALQAHVAFFDTDNDDIIWPTDTFAQRSPFSYEGFRAIGYSIFFSALSMVVIHSGFSTNAAVVEQAVRRGRAVANPVLRAIPAQRRHVTQRGCLIASIAEGGLQRLPHPSTCAAPAAHAPGSHHCIPVSCSPPIVVIVPICEDAGRHWHYHLPALPYHRKHSTPTDINRGSGRSLRCLRYESGAAAFAKR